MNIRSKLLLGTSREKYFPDRADHCLEKSLVLLIVFYNSIPY
jgi:hypothetical protein